MARSKAIVGIVFLIFISSRIDAAQDSYSLINAHEHIESESVFVDYLQVAPKYQIQKTLLVGSPQETFRKTESHIFSGEDNNNQLILDLIKKYPDQIIFFPTINIHDPEKVNKLKQYVSQGAKGVKLYTGHTYFHDVPLDDEKALEVYEFCQKSKLPIIFHVNVGYYQEEFERVLKKYPKLDVICPHFCLSTIKEERFRYLMTTYPRLWTDISFGHMPYLISGLKRFSEQTSRYRKLILDYQDRIFFGTDMVLNQEPNKNVEWIGEIVGVYRDLLEKKEFAFFAMPSQKLNGFAFEKKVLKKIYAENIKRLLSIR